MPLEAQRLAYMGEFAHLLHIPVWDIARLSVDEFNAYVSWLDAHAKANQE